MKKTKGACRLAIAACAGGLMLSGTGPASADLRDVYAGVFESNDVNGSGRMSRAEYLHLQELVFLQIDDNEDDFLGAQEWNNWDPRHMGIEYEPAEIGKIYAVMARTFVTMDHDGDGRLTRSELGARLFGSFVDADESNDDTLNLDEFIKAHRLPTIVKNDLEEMFGGAARTTESAPVGTGILPQPRQ